MPVQLCLFDVPVSSQVARCESTFFARIEADSNRISGYVVVTALRIQEHERLCGTFSS